MGITKTDLITAFLASSQVTVKPGRIPSLVLGDLTLTLYTGRYDAVLHMTETTTGHHLFTHVRRSSRDDLSQLFQEKLLSLQSTPKQVEWQFAVNRTVELLCKDLEARRVLQEAVKTTSNG